MSALCMLKGVGACVRMFRVLAPLLSLVFIAGGVLRLSWTVVCTCVCTSD